MEIMSIKGDIKTYFVTYMKLFGVKLKVDVAKIRSNRLLLCVDKPKAIVVVLLPKQNWCC